MCRLNADTILDFAQALAQGVRIDVPVVVVVAHPDDETLGLGARLRCLRDCTLIHLTDGAPRDLADAWRAGFANAAEYATHRQRELEAALRALDVAPARRHAYGYADQQALDYLLELTQRLRRDLAGCAAVITHTYEHGHPDHDAAAFGVHAACALLRRAGAPAPQIVEFAGYHLRAGAVVFGQFWPDAEHEAHVAHPDERGRSRKRDALGCFASQREFLARFPIDSERFRLAPKYAFGEFAPPREAFYELLNWNVTRQRWHERARFALAELDLHGAL